MEKISALIEKLQELKNSGAGLQAISYYVQLLQAELLHARAQQREEQQPAQRHVAVIMPVQPAQVVAEATAAHYNGHTSTNRLHTTTAAPEKKPEPPAPPVARPQPVEAVRPAPAVESKPAPEKKPVAATLFDVEKTAPAPPPPPPAAKESNGLRKELKELNELVSQPRPSLNDQLKQRNVELGEKLGDMPVKDLKQAIGINDKFLFIQELFRGDVDLYERSIKTINEFRTLQEAEYWIDRELKIWQGWDDDARPVKHFYSLLRKRFS